MNRKNNKGQSTIEFIMTFTSAVGFIFLFFKMAINYTNGYMVHHATYMASRAFLVNDSEGAPDDLGRDQAAFKLANSVFAKNLPKGLVNGFDGKLTANFPAPGMLIPFIGVWIQYTQPFSMGFIGGKDVVTFRSESFLGREPTRLETMKQVCSAIKKVVKPAAAELAQCVFQATLDDNGG
jgi:hypothetical protein